MTTAIPAVDTEVNIQHGVLIDLTLDDTTYYISNCYTSITYNSNLYQALAGFLSVGEVQTNISNTNDEIQITLSAIPSNYIEKVLGEPIKGGSINIYRAFFDYNTQQVLTGQVYRRFTGVITNFSVQEDIDATGNPSVTHTIVVQASSIMGVLENLFAGRRTNQQDYQRNYAPERYFTAAITTDPSMNKVAVLHNASFDFGKKYVGQAASTGTGTTNIGPGSGGFYIPNIENLDIDQR